MIVPLCRSLSVPAVSSSIALNAQKAQKDFDRTETIISPSVFHGKVTAYLPRTDSSNYKDQTLIFDTGANIHLEGTANIDESSIPMDTSGGETSISSTRHPVETVLGEILMHQSSGLPDDKKLNSASKFLRENRATAILNGSGGHLFDAENTVLADLHVRNGIFYAVHHSRALFSELKDLQHPEANSWLKTHARFGHCGLEELSKATNSKVSKKPSDACHGCARAELVARK